MTHIWPFQLTLPLKIRSTKYGADMGTDFPAECKTFCKAVGTPVYFTMRRTRAAFAERAKRYIKIILTDTWKIITTNTFTNCLSSSQP